MSSPCATTRNAPTGSVFRIADMSKADTDDLSITTLQPTVSPAVFVYLVRLPAPSKGYNDAPVSSRLKSKRKPHAFYKRVANVRQHMVGVQAIKVHVLHNFSNVWQLALKHHPLNKLKSSVDVDRRNSATKRNSGRQ